MSMPALKTLTDQAATDDLTLEDYWDIYHFELRQWDDQAPSRSGRGPGEYNLSLTDFCAVYSPDMSKAMWSKFHTAWNAGDTEEAARVLTRRARNILRRGVGRPELPPTVGDVLAGVDPNARVVQIGEDGRPRLAILIAAGADADHPLRLHISSTVRLLDEAPARPARARPKSVRPLFSPSLDERRRRLDGVSWNDIAERGLAAYEAERAQIGR